MPQIIVVNHAGEEKSVDAAEGRTLMEVIREELELVRDQFGAVRRLLLLRDLPRLHRPGLHGQAAEHERG